MSSEVINVGLNMWFVIGGIVITLALLFYSQGNENITYPSLHAKVANISLIISFIVTAVFAVFLIIGHLDSEKATTKEFEEVYGVTVLEGKGLKDGYTIKFEHPSSDSILEGKVYRTNDGNSISLFVMSSDEGIPFDKYFDTEHSG